MARELMRRADQESAADGGNEMIAAEFLWGAFAHCLITVAQNEGLPHDSHGAFSRIAQHLDAAQGGNERNGIPMPHRHQREITMPADLTVRRLSRSSTARLDRDDTAPSAACSCSRRPGFARSAARRCDMDNTGVAGVTPRC